MTSLLASSVSSTVSSSSSPVASVRPYPCWSSSSSSSLTPLAFRCWRIVELVALTWRCRLLTEFSCSPLSFNSFLAKQMCFSSAAAPLPWLFMGLGNPGDKYRGTRHNVEFEMIDAFAASVGIPMDTVYCKALFRKGFVGNIPIFFAKPQTYMNLSGDQ
ncbi:hypothetical protein S83_035643 [Arachis hypogaea]